jgi:hypothetical protein
MTAPRRCDCESSSCHPDADCSRIGTVKTTHSTVCTECAAVMPAKYIAAFANVADDEGYKDEAFARYRQEHGISEFRRLGDMPLQVVREVLQAAQKLKEARPAVKYISSGGNNNGVSI